MWKFGNLRFPNFQIPKFPNFQMPKFKLVIEYAGTKYSGWQIQKNARTVAGEIERAVEDATRRREFELYGAGRTDAGVHALAQVAISISTPTCRRRRCATG
jgi:tRNA pseudouridine(38-40) synthase